MKKIEAIAFTRRIHTPPQIREHLRRKRFSNTWGNGEKSPTLPQLIDSLAKRGEDIWLEMGAKSFKKTDRPNKQDLVTIDSDFHNSLTSYAEQCNSGSIEKEDTSRKIGIEDVYINFLMLAYEEEKTSADG